MQSTSTVLYCAYLSVVAREFRQRIILVDRVKNGIEYKNVFDGREAIVSPLFSCEDILSPSNQYKTNYRIHWLISLAIHNDAISLSG